MGICLRKQKKPKKNAKKGIPIHFSQKDEVLGTTDLTKRTDEYYK